MKEKTVRLKESGRGEKEGLEEEKGRDKLWSYVNLIKEIIFKTYRREYSLEFSRKFFFRHKLISSRENAVGKPLSSPYMQYTNLYYRQSVNILSPESLEAVRFGVRRCFYLDSNRNDELSQNLVMFNILYCSI